MDSKCILMLPLCSSLHVGSLNPTFEVFTQSLHSCGARSTDFSGWGKWSDNIGQWLLLVKVKIQLIDDIDKVSRKTAWISDRWQLKKVWDWMGLAKGLANGHNPNLSTETAYRLHKFVCTLHCHSISKTTSTPDRTGKSKNKNLSLTVFSALGAFGACGSNFLSSTMCFGSSLGWNFLPR